MIIDASTFTPNSPEVRRVVPARGFLRGKLGPRVSYSGIVVHTTGAGVLAKAKRWGVMPLEAAVRVFSRQIDNCSHYVICGTTGDAVQIAPEERAARHVGATRSDVYARPNWAGASWWKRAVKHDVLWWCERWPDLKRPYDLADGQLWMPPDGGARTCNGNTIGIEIVPRMADPQGPWTDACWGTLLYLIQDICIRRLVPQNRNHIITHSDAHPVTRTSHNRPWDPGPRQWDWDTWTYYAGERFRPPVPKPKPRAKPPAIPRTR